MSNPNVARCQICENVIGPTSEGKHYFLKLKKSGRTEEKTLVACKGCVSVLLNLKENQIPCAKPCCSCS